METQEVYSKDSISPLRKLNLVFRFSYAIPFFLTSLCGIVYAMPLGVPLHIAALIPATVLILGMLVNFSNDYYDHLSGIDKHINEQRAEGRRGDIQSFKAMEKIYWEGNQFDTGLVTETQGKRIVIGLTALAVLLSVPIVIYGGWIPAVLGGVGLFLLFFYTAPPVNLGARGLGEVTVWISFFMMCFFSYYVAAGVFDWGIFVFSVAIATIVALMRLVDSLSSQEAHIEFGELCLSVRIGKDRTVTIAKAMIIFSYAMIAVLTAINLVYAVLFLTVPIVAKAWKILDERGDRWELRAIPPFFGFNFLSEVLFIVATLITAAAGPFPLL